MSTLLQRYKWKTFKKKKHKWTPALTSKPQVRGTVARARLTTPRKPNSAKRPIAKVFLTNKFRVTTHLPGKDHKIRKFSSVLVRGGGARDLPGAGYSCIRGVYDFEPMAKKTKRRSVYGTKKPLKEDEIKKTRKCILKRLRQRGKKKK